MATKPTAKQQTLSDAARLISTRYGCGPVRFAGTEEALYERHLLFDSGVDLAAATARDRFEALARSVRDILSQRWLLTEKTLRGALLTHGDYYMHLADLKSYLEADERLRALYADSEDWARKAILNVASSGRFSSDRTVAEYAAEIWNVQPCPVPEKRD